ncbi:tRNA (N6-threonylcarbamoyladenosine(37)-N6)-meth yltransferase TrmO [Desulfonema ishimotonii]|uniref:tRNA (N6-threonylcarbamoyladenosine(37)-N6)-meth yltransferase TrmO n=1 Tax=Desulfonema ishimotonii TaxID=45657 RepID=A0A401G3U3_9BACT|nr:tRNA (N6-threonylcarbamoyladenosine(37)-N6)-methyltransferase TrmO [Desulfonema ishimotonii]GBC63912.1 tRNA (N6-threonylcarbamoyladenosine(37)-N6)-meth yltransferase TrmO [Desulfonema ishimotonii]
MQFTFEPVGVVHSCFREKFGIPRQAGIVPDATAVLEILPPFDRDEAFRGLEEFSHIWLTFVFHACMRELWKPTVRPPRLGGNRRIGVFATRSDFRPNPIGLSAVALAGITREGGKLLLRLGGVDLLDGTPVLDIKPYIPYADAIPGAKGGFAAERPRDDIPVTFSPEALAVCREKATPAWPDPERLIRQMLQTDPRPAYYGKNPRKSAFGIRIFDVDVKWSFREGGIHVLSVEDVA